MFNGNRTATAAVNLIDSNIIQSNERDFAISQSQKRI